MAVEPGVPCRMCGFCKKGVYNLCPDMQFCATPPVHGNLSRYSFSLRRVCTTVPRCTVLCYVTSALVHCNLSRYSGSVRRVCTTCTQVCSSVRRVCTTCTQVCSSVPHLGSCPWYSCSQKRACCVREFP